MERAFDYARTVYYRPGFTADATSDPLRISIESVLSDASEGVITGFGVYGYLLALDAILHLLNQKANVPQSGERSH